MAAANCLVEWMWIREASISSINGLSRPIVEVGFISPRAFQARVRTVLIARDRAVPAVFASTASWWILRCAVGVDGIGLTRPVAVEGRTDLSQVRPKAGPLNRLGCSWGPLDSCVRGHLASAAREYT